MGRQEAEKEARVSDCEWWIVGGGQASLFWDLESLLSEWDRTYPGLSFHL